MEPLLRSVVLADVVEDLLTGLIAAYVFYLAIELWPRAKRERAVLDVLNMLIAAIVNSYAHQRIFGHETSVAIEDTSLLNADQLQQYAFDIKNPDADYLRLKFAMQTAHSRYNDFQHSLGIAAGLSPNHALAWLALTDKVRLLAEEYNSQQQAPGHQTRQCRMLHETDAIKSTLQLRVMEFMEQAKAWVLIN